jgi:hypothetical protein
MKVLVVGSTHGLETDIDIGEFQSACVNLGFELARAGHELILGSNRPSTADHWIAQGADRFAKRRTRLTIYGPDDRRTKFDQGSYSNLELNLQRVQESWTGLRPKQVLLADVVILIGGRRGTRQAGLNALEMKKPVLPIATFGGAAEEIWIEVRRSLRRAPVLHRRLNELQVSWSNEAMIELVNSLETAVEEITAPPDSENVTTVFSTKGLEKKYWTSFDGIKRVIVIAKTRPLVLLLILLALGCAFALFSYSIQTLLDNAAIPEMTAAVVGQAVAGGIEQGKGSPSFSNNTILAFFTFFLATILIIGILLVLFSKKDNTVNFGMNLITTILGFVTGSLTKFFGLTGS